MRLTGNASKTSLAMTTPLNFLGSSVSHSTRSSSSGKIFLIVSFWVNLSLALSSIIKYFFGRDFNLPSSKSVCAARIPLPAPNSRISPPSSTCLHCLARQKPKRSETSGEVIKSPLCPKMVLLER